MTESSQDLAAVEQLLTESDALKGWLARLDQAPAGGSGDVRDRVRADYQKRLDQITAGLSAHTEVVENKLAEDRSEHADLLARANSARDALAEAELRHAVGEYDTERFEGEQRRHSSDLESFELALGAASERIGKLEAVHALVHRAPRTPTDDAPPNQASATVQDAPTMAIADLAPDVEPPAPAVPMNPESQQPAATQPSPVGAPSQGAAPSENGPLSFRPSGATPEWPRPVSPPPARTRTFESAAPLGIPAADIPPKFVRPGERLAPPASSSPTAEAKPEPRSASAEPKGPPSPPVAEANTAGVGRTLRCGECGAMNRPLEWYCEKCGAELTAV